MYNIVYRWLLNRFCQWSWARLTIFKLNYGLYQALYLQCRFCTRYYLAIRCALVLKRTRSSMLSCLDCVLPTVCIVLNTVTAIQCTPTTRLWVDWLSRTRERERERFSRLQMARLFDHDIHCYDLKFKFSCLSKIHFRPNLYLSDH